MPIELGKILRDIAEEKDLRPSRDIKKEIVDLAWLRVAKKNNLSVHEARSIFKVLQKKYDQEKTKSHSTWKLYNVLHEIHSPADPEPDEGDDEDMSVEENEEYEMLEVDEEQQQQENPNQDDDSDEQQSVKQSNTLSKQNSAVFSNTEMNSDGESPTKSKSDTSHDSSTEQTPTEKQTTPMTDSKKSPTNTQQPQREEKKLLNSLASPNSTRAQKTLSPASAAAAVMQKKGITLKKTTMTTPASQTQQQKQQVQQVNKPLVRNGQIIEVGKTIQLPESIKRKLLEDVTSPAVTTKKMLLGQSTGAAANQISPKAQTHKLLTQSNISTSGSLLIKKETQPPPTSPQNSNGNNNLQTTAAVVANATLATNITATTNTVSSSTTTTQHGGIKIITFPVDIQNNDNNSNSNGNGNVEATSHTTNGNSTINTNGIPTPPRIDELDFSNNIIIESNTAKTAVANQVIVTKNDGDLKVTNTNDSNKEAILNLGNINNELPRAFFTNLCNSSRYEALGLYVANVMNRLDAPKAARLELKIMSAVIDAQTENLQDS